MAIDSGDIKFYLSGGAANADPDAALGGAVSSTEVIDSGLDNLFDSVDGAEAIAGSTEYRCFYVKNVNGADTLLGAGVYISDNTESATTYAEIGLGTSAINATEQTVADESTAPSGVSFSQADYDSPLVIGDLAPDERKAVWLKRVVEPGTDSAANEFFTIGVTGETLP